MPRPPVKRRKPNQSPSSRVGKFNSQATKAELDRRLANKVIGKRPQDSDDSDNLVTKTTSRNRYQSPRQEIYASGGVGKGDEPGAWPRRLQRTQSMREDTAEILRQRSRSLSRATSDMSNEQANNEKKSVEAAEEPGHNTPVTCLVNSPNTASIQPAKQVSRTPSGDTSVLGRIKPRKRQHSILRLIDDNESAIHTGDEEEFLPDEISTPLEINRIQSSQQAESRPFVQTSESRKRKRGSELIRQSLDSNRIPVKSSLDSMTPAISLPTPSRTQSKRLEQQKALEDEILALPQSSPEASPQKPKSPAIKRKVQQETKPAPSTQQLRSLMPSSRYTSARPKRQQKNEFDIPEDSTSELQNLSDENGDHSTFVPNKTSKSKSRKGMTASKSKKSATSRNVIKDKPRNIIAKSKMNKSAKIAQFGTVSTPSPKRLRKPLPLSSAKTRIQLQDKTNTTNTPLAANKTRTTRDGKQTGSDSNKDKDQILYGGSQLRSGRLTRAGKGRATGKENDPVSLVDMRAEGQDTIDQNENEAITETIEIINYDSPSKKQAITPKQQQQHQHATSDMQAWQKKWADIDDYSLDFEEVSPASLEDSARSSQRDMR